MSQLEKSQIEKTKQIKDKNSEDLFEKLYSKYIINREHEFGVRTNELIYQKEGTKMEGCGFPDFLLKIGNQLLVAEITTSHDLDDPGAKTPFRPGRVQVTDPSKQIFNRIKRKMEQGNFKNVEDFQLPIFIVLFNNNFSSQIDETDVDLFMNDYKKYDASGQDILSHTPNYLCIEKIPKHGLISGILLIKSSNEWYKTSFFPHSSSKSKLEQKTVHILEKPA